MKRFSILLAVCGVFGFSAALPHTQIIGGEDAQQGEFPYQILMVNYDFNMTHCGGALVVVEDKQFILTSETCLLFLRQDNGTQLIAGDLKKSEHSGREQVRHANRFIRADDYNSRKRIHNLAIVAYWPPFELNEDVQPIPLPEQGQVLTGDVVFTGWGELNYDGTRADHLQKVTHGFISDEECAKRFEGHPEMDAQEEWMCSSVREGEYLHCDGDMGGPAKAVNGGYLAGIQSFPEFCSIGLQGYPEVYTDISYYVDWIKRKARDL